jgi:hypothetical protein
MGKIEIRVGEGHLRSHYGELRETIQPLRALVLEVIGRHEVVDLRRVVTPELRWIEA